MSEVPLYVVRLKDSPLRGSGLQASLPDRPTPCGVRRGSWPWRVFARPTPGLAVRVVDRITVFCAGANTPLRMRYGGGVTGVPRSEENAHHPRTPLAP